MKGGWTFCYKCTLENKEDLIAQKLLWYSQDLECRCDRCSRKIQDVS
jgi:hypothetical protein